MHYETALPIAQNIVNILSPFCLPGRCLIAGSIRREKQEVKDIKIIAQYTPKNILLFYNELHKVLPIIPKAGNRYIQGVLKEGINLDLFIPQSHDFYRQLAIRTGPSEYSQKVLATGWVKMGWRGTKDGLRLAAECNEYMGIYSCLSKTPTLPPVWASEKEFFSWLKIPYLHPSMRNY